MESLQMCQVQSQRLKGLRSTRPSTHKTIKFGTDIFFLHYAQQVLMFVLSSEFSSRFY